MKIEKKVIKAKILRMLGITKPIQLDKSEIKWIKFCKGHYADEYRTNASNWIDSMKPMFQEIYAYNPNEHYEDYLNCIFNELLDIYLKIKLDYSGCNSQLKEIFNQSFYESFRRNYERPIERSIAELCGQIQINKVIENGVNRYYLN